MFWLCLVSALLAPLLFTIEPAWVAGRSACAPSGIGYTLAAHTSFGKIATGCELRLTNTNGNIDAASAAGRR